MAISVGMAILAASFYGLATFTQNINPVDPGPAFYPRIVSALLFAAAVVHVAVMWRAGRAHTRVRVERKARSGAPGTRYALGTLLLSAAYVGAFDRVPYLAGAAGFLLALMLFAGVRRWTVLSGAAIAYALVTYYVFGKVLMVPLP
jgi:hypothetical protein